MGSDHNFKPISELEEQEPKEFYWDYDGRRRVRNQVNLERLAEVSPVKTNDTTENVKLAKVSSQVHQTTTYRQNDRHLKSSKELEEAFLEPID